MFGDLQAERTSINGNIRLRVHIAAIHKAYGYQLYHIFSLYVKTAPKKIIRKFNPLTQQSSTFFYLLLNMLNLTYFFFSYFYKNRVEWIYTNNTFKHL